MEISMRAEISNIQRTNNGNKSATVLLETHKKLRAINGSEPAYKNWFNEITAIGSKKRNITKTKTIRPEHEH